MDLSKLDTVPAAEEGQTMELKHPVSGEPIEGASITLAGADSDRYRKASFTVADRRLKAMQRRNEIDTEKFTADMIEQFAAATLRWAGIEWPDANGKPHPLECTPANARMIYARLPWLREQVDVFITDRANFLKASSKI